MSISESVHKIAQKEKDPHVKFWIYWNYQWMKLWSRVPLFKFASIYVNFRSFAIRSSKHLGSFSSRRLLGFCEIQKASIVCGLEPYMFVTCFGTSVWFVSPHNSICSPDYCLPLHAMFLNELWEFHVSRTETEYIYDHLCCFQS